MVCLVLSGLATMILEETFIHTDDGCLLETHCNACLLQLATPGLTAVAFSLPEALPTGERVAATSASSHEQPEPGSVSSRGPPSA